MSAGLDDMKSSSASGSSAKEAQDFRAGVSRMLSPSFLMITSLIPSNSNSLGSLTAWFLPFLNNLAVFTGLSLTLIMGVYA